MKGPLWPIPLDPGWARIELEQVKELGISYSDPNELRTIFEQKICEFTGAKYCVAVQSCTDALELCLLWYLRKWSPYTPVHNCEPTVPKWSYISVPSMIHRLFGEVKFSNVPWEGCYQIKPLPIWDCAPRFTKGMYVAGQMQCLSFQIKKRLPIGRGGAILTDNAEAARWMRLASYDGRDLNHPDGRWQTEFEMIGRHVYLSPEDCARGIILLHKLQQRYPDGNIPDCQKWSDYPDLSKASIFR